MNLAQRASPPPLCWTSCCPLAWSRWTQRSPVRPWDWELAWEPLGQASPAKRVKSPAFCSHHSTSGKRRRSWMTLVWTWDPLQVALLNSVCWLQLGRSHSWQNAKGPFPCSNHIPSLSTSFLCASEPSLWDSKHLIGSGGPFLFNIHCYLVSLYSVLIILSPVYTWENWSLEKLKACLRSCSSSDCQVMIQAEVFPKSGNVCFSVLCCIVSVEGSQKSTHAMSCLKSLWPHQGVLIVLPSVMDQS